MPAKPWPSDEGDVLWLEDLLAEIEDLQRRLAEAGPTAHLTRGRVTVDVATGSYL